MQRPCLYSLHKGVDLVSWRKMWSKISSTRQIKKSFIKKQKTMECSFIRKKWMCTRKSNKQKNMQ